MSPARGAGLRAELSIALIALIWGATFVLVKGALEDASTFVFLALRFGLAAALLFLAFRTRRSVPAGGEGRWLGGVVCGALLFLGYALQTAGLRFTTASKSAFITGLYIVMVPLLSSLVSQSVPRLAEWAGIAAATAGTALLTVRRGDWSWNSGDVLTLGCALAFAMHLWALGHWSKRMSVEDLSLMQVAVVAVLSAGCLGWLETPVVRWTPRLWVALLVTAVLATSLSFALQTWAQRHTTPARAALIFSLEPVFAGLTGWWVAGEQWTAPMAGGAALILAGIVLVELKPRPASAHPSD